MAALLPGRPSSPHRSHLSLASWKSCPIKSFLPFSLSSSSPQTSNGRNSGRGRSLLFNHHSSPRSISVVATATEGTAEQSIESPSEARARLIAQNIPWTCNADDIRRLFERHGNVVDVELSMYDSSRNRGLAFITMASEEEAFATLNNLNSYDLDGRVIKVEFARSLKKTPSTELPTERHTVFVGNLSWRVRSRDLRELFDATAKVLSAEVIFQSNPRRSAGYGFVSFASQEEAETAISTFNGKRFMGRPVRLVHRRLEIDEREGECVEREEYGEVSSEVNTNWEL